MLSRLIGKVCVDQCVQKWKAFIEELFAQEDFLPQLHAPNILIGILPEVCNSLKDCAYEEYSYKQREELVLNMALLHLEEKTLEQEYSPWSPDPLEHKEVIRLYSKIEQLLINKGYSKQQSSELELDQTDSVAVSS